MPHSSNMDSVRAFMIYLQKLSDLNGGGVQQTFVTCL